MLKTPLAKEVFAPLWQHAENLTKDQALYRDILLAKKRIRLVFPNDVLFAFLTASFDHIAVATDLTIPADLTIYIWDADSTANVKQPKINWDYIVDSGYRGKTSDSIFFQYYQYMQTITALDLTNNVGIYFMRSTKELPCWLGSSPLLVILNVWFKEQNIQYTHSGAVAVNGKALVFAGAGGSGKSTTVLSCLEDGMGFLAEDYCLLQAGPVPTVHTVYNSAKYEENTLKLFPHYRKHVVNQRKDNEKGMVFYQQLFPDQIVQNALAKAVLSLRVTPNNDPELISIDRETALMDLARSTIVQLPGADKASLELLREFVEQVPCYQLRLGTEIKKNVAMIRSILDGGYA